MRTPRPIVTRVRLAGATLIEQILVVAIIGVLTTVAMPALGGLRQRATLQSAQLELIATLRHARATAITSGRVTQLCPHGGNGACTPSSRWEGGWLIGHVARGNGAEPPPLRTTSGYAGITVLGDSGRKQARFRPDGSAGGSTNTWRLCLRGSPDRAVVVVLANSGRVRSAAATPEQAAQCAAVKD